MGERNTENTKPYSLVITDKYYDNLKQIIYYIAIKQKQPQNAVKVAKEINKTMNKILLNPLIYAKCENIPTKTKTYREAGYKSWLIIFKIKSSEITILGVLSGKQKPTDFRKLTR